MSELDDKMVSHIRVNLRPALDPSGNNHATMIQGLKSSGIIQSDQAIWLLKEDGFLPDEMPETENSQTTQTILPSPSKENKDLDGVDDEEGD